MLDIFFKEIRPRGSHRIPQEGPVIFVVAPHVNQVSLSSEHMSKYFFVYAAPAIILDITTLQSTHIENWLRPHIRPPGRPHNINPGKDFFITYSHFNHI